MKEQRKSQETKMADLSSLFESRYYPILTIEKGTKEDELVKDERNDNMEMKPSNSIY